MTLRTRPDPAAYYRHDTGHGANDVIDAWGLGFNLGCVVKYVCRADLKGDAIGDLEKARDYISREIEKRRGAGK